MSPILDCIVNKKSSLNPVWIMRQAGRYLPEFREIRKINQDFIKLCLNDSLSKEITLQPLRRFKLDAAIIFSDILMVPYGLGQEVKFKKNFGPMLGEIDIDKLKTIDENDFVNKLSPIYNLLNSLKSDKLLQDKDLFGFVGAPWTILVYMLNKQSPKKEISHKIFNDKEYVGILLQIIDKFLKIHIKNQFDSGASVIQIFDSWAGLVDEKNLEKYIYSPTLSLVNYAKSIGVPVICFPRNIKNYKKYVDEVKPDAINIDYNIDPKQISKEVDITVQGGINPNILLKDNDSIKREVMNYYNIFKDKPYIFNLGHGVVPETNPNSVEFFVNSIKDL